MVVLSEDLLWSSRNWTKNHTKHETKSTYQYVIDLKDKLKQTCELARGELRKSHEKYRIQYNRKARNRTFKIGDEVVLLLPADRNKLLMHWKGPSRVVDVVGKLDYRIDTGKTVTTFHANLLKKYLRRDQHQMPEADQPTTLDIAATSMIEEEDVDKVDKDVALREDPL